MTQLPIHTLTSAPEAARPLLAQVHKALGFVPNLYATFAESPPVLQGYLALSGILDKGTLTPAEQELLHVAISTENACTYCVAAHSTLAGMKRIDRDTLEAVRTGHALPDAKLNTLIDLTREAIRRKGLVSGPTRAAFLAAGYTEAQLLEVIAHIGLKTIANYINTLADTPLDEAFQAQAWKADELQEVTP
jgi:uncharacterized peroxidase-related enzyme